LYLSGNAQRGWYHNMSLDTGKRSIDINGTHSQPVVKGYSIK